MDRLDRLGSVRRRLTASRLGQIAAAVLLLAAGAVAAAVVTAQASPPALIGEFPDYTLPNDHEIAIDLTQHFSGDDLSYTVMVTTTHKRTGQVKTGELGTVARNKVSGGVSGNTLTLKTGPESTHILTLEVQAAGACADVDCEPVSDSFEFRVGYVPATPGAPTASAATGQVAVSWSAPENTGNSELSDYDVQYKKSNESAWSDWAHTGTATSATVTGLEASTGYDFQVRASNSDGASPWSDSASATTPAPPAPVAPAAPAAPNATAAAGQVALNWSAPSDNGSAITDYDVQYRESGESSWSDWTHTGTATAATVTGLADATAYDFQVQASNAGGASGWSATASATTPAAAAVAPAAPAAPSTTAGSDQVALSWSAPNDNGSTIADYDVQYQASGGSSWSDWPHTGTGTAATVTGLEASTAYQFQVRASNEGGAGHWSPAASATTTAAAPATPAAPTVTFRFDRAMLSWSAPTDATATGYNVQYRQSTETDWQDWPHTGTAISTTVTGLVLERTYEFRVQAITADGAGAWSASASGSTPLDIPATPATPTNPYTGWSQVRVDWTAPSDSGLAIFDYDVHYKKSSDGVAGWKDLEFNGTGTHLYVRSLEQETSYDFRVRATNGAGSSGWSATLTATTAAPLTEQDAGAPPLEGLGIDYTSITLDWARPPSYTFRFLAGYDIRVRPVGRSWWTNIYHSAPSYTAGNPANTLRTLTGLAENSTHEIQLRWWHLSTSGPWSRMYRVTTLSQTAAAPGVVDTPSASASAGQVALTWLTPLTNSGTAITDYDVEYRKSGESAWTSWTHTGTDRSATVTGLDAGTEYEFQVRAVNSIGDGSWSLAATATTPAAEEPSE